MVGMNDRTIPPALERFFAGRMHAHTVEINSSHAAMVFHPEVRTSFSTPRKTASNNHPTAPGHKGRLRQKALRTFSYRQQRSASLGAQIQGGR
jgi:hypothetical protein